MKHKNQPLDGEGSDAATCSALIREILSRIHGDQLTILLNAKCLWCGYNGQRYWQAGTHDKSCPWHSIGGATERKEVLPDVIPDLFLPNSYIAGRP